MNKIEEQILKNQWTIISVLRRYSNDQNNAGHISSLSERVEETRRLLNPEVEPSLPEKTKVALNVEEKIE